MIQWAKRAGKLVFQEAEELHEDNIMTFCNLALFWHSQGSWRVASLHKGLEPSTWRVRYKTSSWLHHRKCLPPPSYHWSRVGHYAHRKLTWIRNTTTSLLGLLSFPLSKYRTAETFRAYGRHPKFAFTMARRRFRSRIFYKLVGNSRIRPQK